MKPLLITLIAAFVIAGATQSPTGSGLSPKDVVGRLWQEATEGELLTPDGWNRASRWFVQPDPFPTNGAVRNRFQPLASSPLLGAQTIPPKLTWNMRIL